MAASDQPSARFRPATDFPKKIEHLDPSAANLLYEEMRECLIFTNRSRGQLLRRNEEHKQTALKVKADLARLQTAIQQLNLEKQQLAADSQQVVLELQREMTSMATHLDQLSAAFDTVADIDTGTQSQWGFFALPGRLFNFVRAVKAVVMWWREEQDDGSSNAVPAGNTRPQLPGGTPNEDDRRENPQMYDDPASQGRSLLDR